MKKILSALIFSAALFTFSNAHAQTVAQKANADLSQNLYASNNSFTTDLKQYGLLETLEGKGPFTVFAPTDELYKMSPEFTGEQKISFLKNYIVAQKISTDELAAQFKMHNNQIQLTAISGNTISLTKEGDKILVNMGSGATTLITTMPQESNNGFIIQLQKAN